MDQESSKPTEKKAPGRPPKSNPTAASELEARIANIEACLAKMATLSGNANHLAEFGLKRWDPSKKDMQKYK